MNKTEKLAFNWLKKQGYKEKDIKFRYNKSPDFICSDGKRYEAKVLSKYNFIIFYPVQTKSLKKEDIILVFDKNKFITKFFWEDRKKKLPFGIFFTKGVTIQLPKEVVNKLKLLKKYPQETYADMMIRTLKENRKLKKETKKLEKKIEEQNI